MAKHPIIDHLDRHEREARVLYLQLDAWVDGFEAGHDRAAPEIIKMASARLSHGLLAAYATIRDLSQQVDKLRGLAPSKPEDAP